MLKSNLRVLLAERDIKHKEIAEQLGVTTSTFSHYVNGTAYPKPEKMFQLAKILGCKVDDLYSLDESTKE